MKAQWYMLSVLGKDRPGIVARVSTALYQADCNLGEASMIRLGGNFTIMMMVQAPELASLEKKMTQVVKDMGLRLHIDAIESDLHDHSLADVRISVYGADRTGIVAQVSSALAHAGLDIFDLQSNVAGSDQKPIYIMQIEGRATAGIEALEQALTQIASDVEVHLEAIDTLVA